MDFQTLLSIANDNQEKVKCEISKKRYSTVLAPAKKQPKSNVQSKQIQLFLERKEQEEREELEEASRKRGQLLELRAQKSKNSKKVKSMTSRTKDNDFSDIKMKEEEQKANIKRERELEAFALKDKLDRMKARIELKEREKLLSRKKKKKGKLSSDTDNESQRKDIHNEDYDGLRASETGKIHSKGQNVVHKKPLPRPCNNLNFNDLLKLAAERQHQPIELPKEQKFEDRPLSKKGKRLQQEEEVRTRWKLAGTTKAPGSKYNLGVKNTDPGIQSQRNFLNNCNFKRKSNSNCEQNKVPLGANSITPSSGKINPTVIQLQKGEMSCSNQEAELNKKFEHPYSKQKFQKPQNNSINRMQLSTNCPQQKTNMLNGFKKEKPGVQDLHRLPPRRHLENHKPVKRKLESDDEDEYDDLDGFIDDDDIGSCNQEDYSKHIKEIFKYDSSKYANIDYDDIQESSFAQVCQEEVRSARIGHLEDLEEEKKEKEAIRRKAMKKKKK